MSPHYATYIASPEWRRVRQRYWNSDLPKDCICGETEGLHLHHLTYERLGAERLEDLTPLCPNCHAMIHVLVKRGEIGLDFAGFISEERQRRYATERSAPSPGESWDALHADRLAKQEAKVRAERVRLMDLRLWRTNDPRHGWFVRVIEQQTEAMCRA